MLKLLDLPFDRIRGRIRFSFDLGQIQLLISSIGIGLLIFMATAANFIAPYDPIEQFVSSEALTPPSAGYWMGTDQVGRDIFSRVIFGTRLSLSISFSVMILSLVIGLMIGTIGGLIGGYVDEILMRITDIFLAFPRLILAMAIVATLGRGVNSLIIALSLTWWPVYARLVRGQVISIRERPFVEAARVVGNGSIGLIVKHILPHTFPEVAVRVTLDIGNIILIVSGLSFLGMGAQPPSPEWGAIIGDGRAYSLAAPWLMFFPGMAIVYTILCFSLFGDSLQDKIQPKGARQ